jgi:hypothetical protein
MEDKVDPLEGMDVIRMEVRHKDGDVFSINRAVNSFEKDFRKDIMLDMVGQLGAEVANYEDGVHETYQ